MKQQEQDISSKRGQIQVQEIQKQKGNNREKTSRAGIKEGRTCYACNAKEHKITNYEIKVNVFITYQKP